MKKLLTILIVTCLALALASACGKTTPDNGTKNGSDKSTASGDDFTVMLSVEPLVLEPGGQFRLTLNITNESGEARTFDIPSGQIYDFFATDSASEKVWVWSDGRSFIQSVQQIRFEAGGSKQYMDFWKPEGMQPGKYTIQGLFIGLPTLNPEVVVEVPASS